MATATEEEDGTMVRRVAIGHSHNLNYDDHQRGTGKVDEDVQELVSDKDLIFYCAAVNVMCK